MTHRQQPTVLLSLLGDHQNKLTLNAHWTEDHTKTVAVELVDGGVKIIFDMVVIVFLWEEKILLRM